MSAWLCKYYRCQTCNAFVLQPKDYLNLRFSEERRKRADIAKAETHWDQLAQLCNDGCTKLKILAKNVAFAAQHALKSLQAPESVSPKDLEFAESAEAETIMKGIWLEVGRREFFEGTQDEIGTILLNLRDEVLRHGIGTFENVSAAQILPPGWDRMGQVWMLRTVQLVSVPGYDGRSIGEVFEGEKEEGAMQRQTTVEDLEGLLAQARLV